MCGLWPVVKVAALKEAKVDASINARPLDEVYSGTLLRWRFDPQDALPSWNPGQRTDIVSTA